MADTAAALVIQLTAEISDFKKQMRAATGVFDAEGRKIERRQAKLKAQLSDWSIKGRDLLAGIGIGVAFAQLERLARSAVSTAEALKDVSERTGLSTDKLQELSFGAKAAGVETEDLYGALDKLFVRLGQAQAGGGPLLALLKKYHLEGRSVEDTIYGLADAVQNASTATERYAIVQAAFGKGTSGLVALLSSGSAGLRDFADQAHRLGQVMDKETILKLDELSKKLDQLKVSAINVSAGPLGDVATGITNIINALRQGGWVEGLDALSGGIAGLFFDSRFSTDNVSNRVVQYGDNVRRLRKEIEDINKEIKAEGGLSRPGTTGALSGLQRRLAEEQDRLNKAISEQTIRDYKGKHIGRGRTGLPLAHLPPLSTGGATGTASAIAGDRPDSFGAVASDMGKVNKALAEQIELGRRRIAQLAAEAGAYGMTADEATAYAYQIEALSAILEKNGKITDDDRAKVEALASELKNAAEAARLMSVLNDIRGPANQFRDRQSSLDILGRTGQISGAEHGEFSARNELDFLQQLTATNFADGYVKQLRTMQLETRNATADMGAEFGELFGPGGTLISGIADAAGQAVAFGDDFGESLENLGRTILAQVVSSLVKVGLTLLTNAVMGQALATTATATSAAQAAALTAAWAPAAAMASLATLGANAAPAIAAVIGTVAASQAAGAVGSLVPGFADGTSSAPGGLAWVGERGKELVNLPKGSQVIPNHDLAALTSWRPPQVPSASTAGRAMQVQVIHDGSTAIRYERVSDDHIRILARQESVGVLHTEGDRVMAKNLADRNSRTSKGIDRRRRS